ncbi:unnamed protein product [Candidula unifasciata]|uniref:EF-hand domain-containing protein n=1 Tax=Candidula unifasciata TaxID=100452 RepID=A0A8S3Z6S0_9EUPU|nr:unnamed protein product [Candidula unifasciata]
MAAQKLSNNEMEQLFKKADKDGNGYLSVAELKFLLQQGNKNITETEFNELFTLMDSGAGDKKISYEEFCAGLKKLEEFVEECRQLFVQHDADKSGFLDRKELKKVFEECKFKFTDTEIDEIFKSADPSGDNKISCEEFLNAFS